MPQRERKPLVVMPGLLTLGLLLLMACGGVYSAVLDGLWLGGGVWVLSALLLFPPLQAALARWTGWAMPPLLSLGILVGGFLGGLLLLGAGY